jgi:RimJ/RimL family protein N-acetyltransferase
MNPESHWVADWKTATGELRAYEPTPDEVVRHAPMLASFYNDAYNSAMMDNTVLMSIDDVVEHFDSLRRRGGKPFLLERDGVLLGDADLRHLTSETAEMAILIGVRAEQGRGLGTRFGLLVHGLAFAALCLDRLFIAIVPGNLASQQMFAKLGYRRDDSEAARVYAEKPSDLTYSLDRAKFENEHGAELAQMRWTLR